MPETVPGAGGSTASASSGGETKGVQRTCYKQGTGLPIVW